MIADRQTHTHQTRSSQYPASLAYRGRSNYTRSAVRNDDESRESGASGHLQDEVEDGVIHVLYVASFGGHGALTDEVLPADD